MIIEIVESKPTMKPVNEIYSDFLLGKVKFHKREETEIFHDTLKCFMDGKYNTSANLSAVLYERVFTTRLINETANPPDFVPSKENLKEQLDNLSQRENQIVNIEKLSFRSITQELVKTGVISEDEKNEYDTYYTEVRNPVSHGLTSRIFENVLGRRPANTFETDTKYEKIYQEVAHSLIYMIYDLMAVKVLRKR